jgi:hypothetical protein
VNGSSLQVLQTRDWHSILIYAQQTRIAVPPPTSWAVRLVANIVREPQGPTRLKVRLVQEENIIAVLTQELSKAARLESVLDTGISQPRQKPWADQWGKRSGSGEMTHSGAGTEYRFYYWFIYLLSTSD